ncbi:transposase domain-containing protein [Salmonella enterica]|uniref:transposase domain-containing protein n=1 Tax=Salmonella enterica TaxID=28901 RepID=UPI0038F7173E
MEILHLIRGWTHCKNWLFASSPVASQRAAAIMSLLATALMNGINPHQWLHRVLTRLPQ